MGDFKDASDIDSPNSRLKYWVFSQSTVVKQRKLIKYLHKQTVNLKKRINTLDDIINRLKDEKKLISDNYFTVKLWNS
jgi:predicted  nucleic acid-binding Zn-ribbon protein